MPLDDLRWATSEIVDLPITGVVTAKPIHPEYRRRRRVNILLGVMGVVAGVTALCLESERIFPDAGLITRMVYGNAVANRNYVGRDILENDSQSLTFAVAGIEYTVDTPSRALTPGEQKVLLGYAAWKGLPVFSADGPFSIDP
jgi:hypothetical protein